MKKLLYLSVIAISAITLSYLSSCSGGKPKAEPMFSSADTTYIVSLTDSVMKCFSEKNFDGAFSKIYELGPDQLEFITPENRKALVEYFTTFPVLRYKLESMTWTNDYDVKLTYSFEFFEKPEGDNIPNTMKVTFAPQRLNKKWYLALEKKSSL